MERGRVGDGPVVHDVAPGTVPETRGRLMRRSAGSQVTVASVAGGGDRCVQVIGGFPARIVPVTAAALRVEDLGVEDRLRLRGVLVTGLARCRKRRVDRRRVGRGPVVHDVAAGTVPTPGRRLMRRSRRSQIAVAVVAGAGHGRVQELGLCPIRIVGVTAGALGLDDLGVEERLRSRVVSVTRHAGRRKRGMEHCRVGCGPVGGDVARGAITLARRGLVRGRVGSPICVTAEAGARRWHVKIVGLHPIGVAPMAADTLGLDGLSVEERLRSRLVLMARHARCWKRRVDSGRHRRNPLVFGVAVLASRGEVAARWIERLLAVCFMARDAFCLADRAWFMRSSSRHATSYANADADPDPEGRKATQHSAGTKPHGLSS